MLAQDHEVSKCGAGLGARELAPSTYSSPCLSQGSGLDGQLLVPQHLGHLDLQWAVESQCHPVLLRALCRGTFHPSTLY